MENSRIKETLLWKNSRVFKITRWYRYRVLDLFTYLRLNNYSRGSVAIQTNSFVLFSNHGTVTFERYRTTTMIIRGTLMTNLSLASKVGGGCDVFKRQFELKLIGILFRCRVLIKAKFLLKLHGHANTDQRGKAGHF